MKPIEPTATATAITPTAAPCPLSGLGVGCRGRVLSVCGDRDARRRLLEMGFCNGAIVETIRRAPFGDPIEYRLRGYCLSLREQQACCVTVQSLS
jgi:ferrous iron transport protein A